MHSQLRQIIFLAGFGFLCCIFIFFLPWGWSSTTETQTPEHTTKDDNPEQNELSDTASRSLLSGTLHIQIDKKLYGSGMQQLIDNYSKQYPIHITLNTLEADKDKIKTSADLILTRYEHNTINTMEKINFSQNITNFLITGFQSFEEGDRFIPYLRDPLLLISGQAQESSYSLADYYNFWLSTAERTPLFLLAPHLKPQLQNQDFVFFLMIKMFAQQNNNWALLQWRDMIMSSSPTIQNKLWDRSALRTDCQEKNLLCLIQNKMLAYGFDYYSNLSDTPEITLLPLPNAETNQTAQLYWRSIPQSSKNKPAAQSFILTALQAEQELLLTISKEAKSLPVFSDIFPLVCKGALCEIGDHIDIIDTENNEAKGFFETTLYKKFMEKKLKPDLYLENAFI